MNEKKCEKECCQKTRSASFLYEKDLKWEDAEPGVTVPAEAAGCKSFSMTRGVTGTNLFITKLEITKGN